MLGGIAMRRSSLTETFSENFINQYELDNNVPYKKILLVFFFANLWTLVLTAIPAVTTVGPDNYYGNHPDWYTGDDVIRFIEPIGGLPINFWLFYQSGILNSQSPDEQSLAPKIVIFLFMFGAAVYVQGGGMHSASAMFTNCLQTIEPSAFGEEAYHNLYYYIRTIWQHIVSHYLYAAGLAIMQMCQIWAYREHVAPHLGIPKTTKLLLFLAALTGAVLLTGVATQFPSGTIVGFVYIIIYGLGIVGGYLYYLWRTKKEEPILRFGQRPILHYALLMNLLALLFLLIWLGVAGGFKSNQEADVNGF